MKLTTARYVMHKIVAHRYAVAVFNGRISRDEATQRYNRAMANFDQIVAKAGTNALQDTANAEALARGPLEIDAVIEAYRTKGGGEDV